MRYRINGNNWKIIHKLLKCMEQKVGIVAHYKILRSTGSAISRNSQFGIQTPLCRQTSWFRDQLIWPGSTIRTVNQSCIIWKIYFLDFCSIVQFLKLQIALGSWAIRFQRWLSRSGVTTSGACQTNVATVAIETILAQSASATTELLNIRPKKKEIVRFL